MGGFCLRHPRASGNDDCYQMIEARDLAFLADQGDMNGFTRHCESLTKCHVELQAVNSISQLPWIKKLRNVTKEEINACAKADLLTKVIACTQALWILTQVSFRWGEGLAVTLLEIDTSAYIFCAVVAYLLWWQKPQDCSQSIVFDCSLQELEVMRLRGPAYKMSVASRVINLDYGSLSRICIITLAAMFGAVKVAVWNFAFPTVVEIWLWRASALFCISVPILLFIPLMIDRVRGDLAARVSYWFRLVVVMLYACVRLYMIVELFLSLRMIPGSACRSVQWSSLGL